MWFALAFLKLCYFLFGLGRPVTTATVKRLRWAGTPLACANFQAGRHEWSHGQNPQMRKFPQCSKDPSPTSRPSPTRCSSKKLRISWYPFFQFCLFHWGHPPQKGVRKVTFFSFVYFGREPSQPKKKRVKARAPSWLGPSQPLGSCQRGDLSSRTASPSTGSTPNSHIRSLSV